jgi:hypothetical protein
MEMSIPPERCPAASYNELEKNYYSHHSGVLNTVGSLEIPPSIPAYLNSSKQRIGVTNNR